MPYPGVPGKYTSKIDSCVARLMKDKDMVDKYPKASVRKQHAIAICKSNIVPKKDWSLSERANIVRGTVVNAPIRAVGEVGDNRWRAYAVLFSEQGHGDVDGLWFDARSNLHLDWYEQRPWLYHHGLHPTLRKADIQQIGTWDKHGIDELGVFVEGELDLRHKYLEAVKCLLEEQVVFPSSGAMSYLVEIEPDGHVAEWPLTEVSSTVAPAEFRMQPFSQAARAALDVLEPGGIEMSDWRESIKEFVSGRSGEVGGETPSEPEPAPEGVSEPPELEQVDEEEQIAEVARAVAAHLDLEPIVQAITALDEAIRTLDERVGVIGTAVEGMAADEVDRLRSAMAGGEGGWFESLYVASRSAEVLDAQETSNIESTLNQAEKPDGRGIFAAIANQ